MVFSLFNYKRLYRSSNAIYNVLAFSCAKSAKTNMTNLMVSVCVKEGGSGAYKVVRNVIRKCSAGPRRTMYRTQGL